MSSQAGYREFLKKLTPSGVALLSTNIKIDREQLKSNAIVSAIGANFDLGNVSDSGFEVLARLSVVSRQQGKDNDTPPFLTFNSDFVVSFTISSSEFRKEYAQRFSNSEVRLLVWPYFREFLSSMTSRMGLPPLTLPLAFQPGDDEKNDESMPAEHPRMSGQSRKRR